MKDYTKQKSFWLRLQSFVENVQVNDAMIEEEKNFILSQCKSKVSESGTEITVTWLQDCDYFQYTNGVSWSKDKDGNEFQIADDDGLWGVYYNRRWICNVETIEEFRELYENYAGQKFEC